MKRIAKPFRRRPKPAARLPKVKSGPTPSPVATAHTHHTFPIVGIGASAGGLEALELFLGHVPPTSGLAFVVVQHLDPTRKGMLVELLQRCTAMPIVQIKDRMKVKPGQVYVIPSNRDLSILHGVRVLAARVRRTDVGCGGRWSSRVFRGEDGGRSGGVCGGLLEGCVIIPRHPSCRV